MSEEIKRILSDLINLNSWKAIHTQKVQRSLYDNQRRYDKGNEVAGTCDEWMQLDAEERKIQKCEDILSVRVSNFEIPESISVKQFSELTGVPTWTVYRMIHKKQILAEKVKGRWNIFTDIETMIEVA